MQAKHRVAANRTVLFTGFRDGSDPIDIIKFTRENLVKTRGELEGGRPISVHAGKAYVNFLSPDAASRAAEELSKACPTKVCHPGGSLEIWLKHHGRSTALPSQVVPRCEDTSAPASTGSAIYPDASDFDVYLSTAATIEMFKQTNLDEFALQFASWNVDEETSREFKAKDIDLFLKKIEEDESSFEIIGFNEFPYYGGKKSQDNVGDVEREYWLRLQGIDESIAGEDNLAILHVHYKGKWHQVPENRDRSIISQINIRHTAKTREKAFHIKCTDLNKWREKRGTSVVKNIPPEGWKWRSDPERCKSIFKVLIKAEGCTRMVRSLHVSSAENIGCSFGQGQRKALIIANKLYDSDKIPNLPNAIHDGSLLESSLQKLGWDVVFETNLTYLDAEKVISEFVSSIEDNIGACLFAFIGHGIEINGKQFLVPRDATVGERVYRTRDEFEMDAQKQCVLFEMILHRFADARDDTEPTIFVLDCCRNNFCSVREQSRAVPLQREQSSNAIKCDVENSIIVFSTTSGNTADDGPAGQGGPFMATFVEQIQHQGMDLDEALMNARKIVKQKSASCQLAPSTSLLYGKFYFNPSNQSAGKGASITPSSIDLPSLPQVSVLQKIVSDDAKRFWRDYFDGDEQIMWGTFRAALVTEFSDMAQAAALSDIPKAVLDLIKSQVDHNNDNLVHVREFNIFTKKVGIRQRIQTIIDEYVDRCQAQDRAQKTTTKEKTMEKELAVDEDPAASPKPSTDVAGVSRIGNEEDPVEMLALMAPARIEYMGTGTVLGGQKLRQGVIEVLGCWLLVRRERGDDKDPFNIGECSIVRSDKIAAGRGIELIPLTGKNLIFSLSSAGERETWYNALSMCKQLLDEAEKVNTPMFAEVFGELCFVGKNQQICTTRKHIRETIKDIAYAVAKQPLTVSQPFCEVVIRQLIYGSKSSPKGIPKRVCPEGWCSFGLSTIKQRKPGHVGWNDGEIGLHSDDGSLFHGSGSGAGRCYSYPWKVGDRLGCGAIFGSSNTAEIVYFLHNDTVLTTVAMKGETLYPAIGLFGMGCRVEMRLGIDRHPICQDDIVKRCKCQNKGETFASLEEAVNAADSDEVICLKPGKHIIISTLVLKKSITICSEEGGFAEIVKYNGGFVISSEAPGVSLVNLHITAEGGNQQLSLTEGGTCSLVIRSGRCHVKNVDLSCYAGVGLWNSRGELIISKSKIGPCGRHGIIMDASTTTKFEECVFNQISKVVLGCNTGSRLEMAKCQVTIREIGMQAAKVDVNVSGCEWIAADDGKGTCVGASDGATISIVECKIAGLQSAAIAQGQGTKLSFRNCNISECGTAFQARSKSIIAHFDCQMAKINQFEKCDGEGTVVKI